MTYTLRFAALALAALSATAQQRMEALHGKAEALHGVLIDAGCEDRSLWNLTRPAESQGAATPAIAPATQPSQSHGISVDSKTLNAERQDVTRVMNPDLRARQSDPTCALKAGTRAYAVLLKDGRLLDLDDGGNTYAALAVQDSPQGQAMINGRGPGFKPRVTVSGIVQGDRMFANDVKLQ